jgi:tRNA (uracil-5-)-methyltransferase
MLGLTFRVSFQAFFQGLAVGRSFIRLTWAVNVKAAEVLLGVVRDWCAITDKNTTVLDICCGTGTIGISLAKVADLVALARLLTLSVGCDACDWSGNVR